jgi:sarcosine oxidase subunit gamma
MAEQHGRRHGLETLAREAGKSRKAPIELCVRGDLGHLNLRGMPDEEFVRTCETVLGQPLPLEPNTFTGEAQRVYWLGPDEWLVVGDTGRVDELADELEAALEDNHAAINKLSGGQIALHLSGEPVRNLFAKGCTLDFHPRVFRSGQCAQSGLAKANVLFGCLDEDGRFELVVRRSFADYLLRWLCHAGDDHGVRVSEK